ncbi:TPA: hypothetical protein SBF08_001843 [Campylobacter jejuni]|nr:hypothetical protein [Campylobacter jejuni]
MNKWELERELELEEQRQINLQNLRREEAFKNKFSLEKLSITYFYSNKKCSFNFIVLKFIFFLKRKII